MYQHSFSLSPEGALEPIGLDTPAASAPMRTGGVYETVLVNADGAIAFADMHALRMGIGLVRLGVPRSQVLRTAVFWESITGLLRLPEASLSGARRLRIQAYPAPGDDGDGDGVSCIVSVSPVTGYEDIDTDAGVTALCLPIRRAPGPLARIKSTDIAVGLWAREYALRRGAGEALWLTTGGEVIEGAFSNIFIVSGGRLITPPTPGILPGITRGIVLVLAEKAGIPVEERRPSTAELDSADEAFLTSAAGGLLSLTKMIRFDGSVQRIGRGVRGEMTQRLATAYDEAALLGGMPV